jgi:multidrug efflux pump subunit AcrA (membrane-fusion protein)
VVTYQVDVQFDPAGLPVKTGMSAGAAITVESHQDVIQVPTRAIKTQGRNKSVEVLYGDNQTPISVYVTTGASNSRMTEITSCVETGSQCLRDGDRVAVTIPTSTTTGNNAGGLQFPGGGGAFPGGGGQFGGRQGGNRP